MKTSARNEYAGTITDIDSGPVTTEVNMEIVGGHVLAATLTTASAKRMNLRTGQQAIALIKASSVVIVTESDGYVLSARNQLAGTVSRVECGAVSTVVGLSLAGGAQVTASVTNDAVEDLKLHVGQAATAIFKAYQVFVAVRL